MKDQASSKNKKIWQANYGKITILIALVLFLLINLAALLLSTLSSNFKDIIKNNETILVISPHQDDETIIAGGAMMSTLAKGGNVYVIYTLDGITRSPHLSDTQIKDLVNDREKEAQEVLTFIGVPLENIKFLAYENKLGFRNMSNVKIAVQQISDYISTIKPNKIFIPVFEGGNCDHDMTNYVVAKAAHQTNFPKENIWESPEYNSYYLSESILKRLNRFLFIKFPTPPRFLPSSSKSIVLPMSKEELEMKKSMLKIFKSQNVEDDLISRFSYPDQYRNLIDYNYSNGPFDPQKELRYKACLLYKRDSAKCSPFFLCGMNVDDYRNLYWALEQEYNDSA